MSVVLIGPVPSTWQRLKPEISLQWRRRDLYYFTSRNPSNLLQPPPSKYSHYRQAAWKISNYRRGTTIFEDSRGGGTSFEDDDYDSEDEEDRSLDLLVTVVQNLFKKVSRRAKKAVRKILPPAISTQLQVGFSVNGVLILSFLWIAKAFLQVVCTFGSVVFVAIFLLRITWAAITYIKLNGNTRRFIDDDNSWTSAQPVT